MDFRKSRRVPKSRGSCKRVKKTMIRIDRGFGEIKIRQPRILKIILTFVILINTKKIRLPVWSLGGRHLMMF